MFIINCFKLLSVYRFSNSWVWNCRTRKNFGYRNQNIKLCSFGRI